MTTFAVLPVKKLSECKQRLSDVLTPEQRTTLMEEMFIDAVIAAVECDSLAGTVVVSDEQKVRDLATRHGAEAVAEGALGSHSAAATVGIKAAISRGADRVALLASDCPLMTPETIAELLEQSDTKRPTVVIGPDRHGTGTNALVLTPPDVIAPAFGPGSFVEHTARAEAARATVRVARIIELEHDIDTADDLVAVQRLSAFAAR